MKTPKQQIERERELGTLLLSALVSDAAQGSRRQPRKRTGAQVPPDDVLELPEVVELSREEVEQMRLHQRKALTATRKAASFIGADHSHNVRIHVELAQREIRAAFDVLDRAVRRARKAAAA